ncbi:YgjV family protein [Paenibacillus hexagrammi]|uniref:YgjV family protein n=1 Tax=Paenibacillus hexagrammi TaxID=2908839 RepID=A0ABY3SPT9_9BACL|nr:YgjV family protein [Paenibacillus sp. YPD9-1]UJF36067.1 YgjV family protein [Paenibacillus sp. YPD9-1]
MHWKKYAILLPPFACIAILLALYLPNEQKFFAVLIAPVFWTFYHLWIHVDNRRKLEGEDSKKDKTSKPER